MTVRKLERLWTTEEVAEHLGVSVETLYTWRKGRQGPRAAKVGRHLRYDPADVRAWFEQRQEAA